LIRQQHHLFMGILFLQKKGAGGREQGAGKEKTNERCGYKAHF